MDQSASPTTEPPLEAGAESTILFDISRLISRVKRAAPTGIDRVELAFALWLLRDVDADVRFVAVVGGEIRVVNTNLARRLVRWIAREWAGNGSTENGGSLTRLAKFIGATWQRNPDFPVRPMLERPVVYTGEQEPVGETDDDDDERGPSGFGLSNPVRLWARGKVRRIVRQAQKAGHRIIYLNVSHHHLEKRAILKSLRALGDIHIAVLIHDVIPLDFPEYCRDGDATKHRRRIDTVAAFADTVIVNSADTGRRAKSYVDDRPIRFVTAHLGLNQQFWRRKMIGEFIGGAPYFTVVSTIEARKNHLILLQVWRRLVEELGDEAPKLVIVGRRGWEAEAATDLLDRCAALKSHVYEATDLSDNGLMALMKGTRAALMPSFAEGFGLPVAEALTLGVPVIASDIPALVEIGQGIPEHLDPLDGLGWKQMILDYCDPQSARREAQLERIERLVPYSWDSHFETVAEALGLSVVENQ